MSAPQNDILGFKSDELISSPLQDAGDKSFGLSQLDEDLAAQLTNQEPDNQSGPGAVLPDKLAYTSEAQPQEKKQNKEEEDGIEPGSVLPDKLYYTSDDRPPKDESGVISLDEKEADQDKDKKENCKSDGEDTEGENAEVEDTEESGKKDETCEKDEEKASVTIIVLDSDGRIPWNPPLYPRNFDSWNRTGTTGTILDWRNSTGPFLPFEYNDWSFNNNRGWGLGPTWGFDPVYPWTPGGGWGNWGNDWNWPEDDDTIVNDDEDGVYTPTDPDYPDTQDPGDQNNNNNNDNGEGVYTPNEPDYPVNQDPGDQNNNNNDDGEGVYTPNEPDYPVHQDPGNGVETGNETGETINDGDQSAADIINDGSNTGDQTIVEDDEEYDPTTNETYSPTEHDYGDIQDPGVISNTNDQDETTGTIINDGETVVDNNGQSAADIISGEVETGGNQSDETIVNDQVEPGGGTIVDNNDQSASDIINDGFNNDDPTIIANDGQTYNPHTGETYSPTVHDYDTNQDTGGGTIPWNGGNTTNWPDTTYDRPLAWDLPGSNHGTDWTNTGGNIFTPPIFGPPYSDIDPYFPYYPGNKWEILDEDTDDGSGDQGNQTNDTINSDEELDDTIVVDDNNGSGTDEEYDPTTNETYSPTEHDYSDTQNPGVITDNSGNQQPDNTSNGGQGGAEDPYGGGNSEINPADLPGYNPETDETYSPTEHVYPDRDSTQPVDISPVEPYLERGAGLNFATPNELAESGNVPDFILDESGQLIPNPAKESIGDDGVIDVQVNGTDAPSAGNGTPGGDNSAAEDEEARAEKEANEAQKAKIREMIRHFQTQNPGMPIPQEWLDILHNDQVPQSDNGSRNNNNEFPTTNSPTNQTQPYYPDSSQPRGISNPTGGQPFIPFIPGNMDYESFRRDNAILPPEANGRTNRLPNQSGGNDGGAADTDTSFQPHVPDDWATSGELPRSTNEGQVEAGDHKTLDRSSELEGAPTISPERINEVLESFGSPAAGLGEHIYNEGIRTGVNPALALAVFAQETGTGTEGHSPDTKNIGDLRNADGTPKSYETWEEGITDWFNNADNQPNIGSLIDYQTQGTDTNSNVYMANINGLMESWDQPSNCESVMD